MLRTPRTQRSLTTFALIAGVVTIACGERDGNTADGGGTTVGSAVEGGFGVLTIAFNPMYSAYDGNAHEFKVPVKVTGASGKLTVTTSPPEFVAYEPSIDGVTLTTRRAGKCTVTIQDASGNTGTAELTVTENSPGDVEIGAARYANGIDYLVPPEGGIPSSEGGVQPLFDAGPLPVFPEGSLPPDFPDAGNREPPRGGRLGGNRESACTYCHAPEGAPADNGNSAQIDVEHTPQQTAGYSDEDLIKIFTQGVKPANARFRVVNQGGAVLDGAAAHVYMILHSWQVPPATQKGLVAYLRSLTPKAQGEVDFGGFLRGGRN